MEIIKAEHLTKDYGHNRGIFDVSFFVEKGEVFGFLGPNGAGKSTTIRHMMGFSKPQSGNIYVFGKESFKNYSEILNSVGYLPGEIALPNSDNGQDFINVMKKLRHLKDDKMLNYLIDKFKFNPMLETKKMSLGDKRKLAIIVAFMHDPDVLVLDEPTSGLDPIMQQVFIDFIKEEKKRGKTIFLSSHIFNEVEETCDRIAIIKDGKIVSTFKTTNLKHNQNKTFDIVFKKQEDYKNFIQKSKEEKKIIELKDQNENTLKVKVLVHDTNINKLIDILSQFNIVEFNEDKLTLEQYFMNFYKEDKDFGGVLDERDNKGRKSHKRLQK